MASQAEKDTAAAKAKQGGGQTAIDTAAAKAKQNNNNQAAKDTARAKSRQNGGDGGTSARMSQREAAAGLYLAGNDTISAGRGGSGPSFAQREAAAGLTNTMSGRVALRAANPDFPPVGTPLGNNEFFVTQNVAGGGGGEFYAFRVVDEGNGTVSVTTGTVNTVTATGLTPTGKPTELWLKVTFDTDDVVTAASVETSSGTTSETEDYRQIASITWDGDLPTIVQGIKGSQSIASCGATHQWGTLYS
jgi:hypothetical protein